MGLLSIILTILKIIGIILLVIIGLIIFILCLILFVPVRYNIDISYMDKPDIKVRITYLLRMIRAYYVYNPTENGLTIKFLCFNVSKDKKKGNKLQNKSKTGTKGSKRKKKVSKEDDLDAPETDAELTDIADEAQVNEAVINEALNTENTETDNTQNNILQNKSTDETTDTEKSAKAKAGAGSNTKVKKSKASGKKAGNKSGTDGIIEQIKGIITLLKENKLVVKFVWRKIKKLFKHILPGSHVINLKLGLDDPATLGELVGVVSVVRAGTNMVINLTPDFNNKVIEADCHFKGRIRVVTLVYIVLSVYLNKNVKKIINKLKA